MRLIGLLLLAALTPASALAAERARVECREDVAVLIGTDAGWIALDDEVVFVVQDRAALDRVEGEPGPDVLTAREVCDLLDAAVGYVLPAPHPGEDDPIPLPGEVVPAAPPPPPLGDKRGVNARGPARPQLPSPTMPGASGPPDVVSTAPTGDEPAPLPAVVAQRSTAPRATAAAGCQASPAASPAAPALPALFSLLGLLGLRARRAVR